MSNNGKLIVFDGTSGSGKTSLLRQLRTARPEITHSVSVTTRNRRPNEVAGVDFTFISTEAFLCLRDRGALLEHAEVYGRYYGTPAEPVARTLAEGRSIILEVDDVGARQVMQTYPQAVRIFIDAPSDTILAERLRARGSEDDEQIELRLLAAAEKRRLAANWDYFIINSTLDRAFTQLLAIIDREHWKD